MASIEIGAMNEFQWKTASFLQELSIFRSILAKMVANCGYIYSQ